VRVAGKLEGLPYRCGAHPSAYTFSVYGPGALAWLPRSGSVTGISVAVAHMERRATRQSLLRNVSRSPAWHTRRPCRPTCRQAPRSSKT
jgi:hypothetical protein